MAKSKAHKYWNKLTGWASHEGIVQVEVLGALEEFLVHPDRIPEGSREQVQLLFEGWFLMDRRLTRANLTPIDLFIREHERKLKPGEREVYRRFKEDNRFGFFKVEEAIPGEGLKLRLLPEGESFEVVEVEGSKAAEKGSYLVARLLPFEDHWAMPTLIAAFPSDSSYILDRSFGEFGGKLKPGELRPRHVLSLFMPKVDWEREGLVRVKARLAMLLQRWGVADITGAMVEKDILSAHEKRELTHPLLKTILGRAPSPEDARDAAEVLMAWWNLTLPEKAFPRGPKEMMLLKDLQHFVMARLSDKEMGDPQVAEESSRRLTREWLNAPQAELEGRSPLDVIRKERESLGNPNQDFGISLIPTKLELGAGEEEGVSLANQARVHLVKKEAKEALDCLQKAYALMKGSPYAFRVLGNMATAYGMLGRREEAVETLRAALKVNPDYEVARNNLHLLENMTPEEFNRKHRAGFFEKMQIITED